MIRTTVPTSIDKSLVHIKYKSYSLAFSLTSDVVRNNEWVLLGDPVIEVIFDLSEKEGTVVKKRN